MLVTGPVGCSLAKCLTDITGDISLGPARYRVLLQGWGPIDASGRDMLGVEGLKVLMVMWPLVPQAGIDHDCTQIPLSHNEMKLRRRIKNENNRTICLASGQGMTYVQWYEFIYLVSELCDPVPRGMSYLIYHPQTPGILIMFAVCLALFFISQ